MTPVSRGKPCAGNAYARFEEGGVAQAEPRRSALLDKEEINKCTVFVSSADSYSDIWPAFFALFKREWPEFHGTIYLNTEETTFACAGLDIICTQVGKQHGFGETLRAGLGHVRDCDTILFLMIDYFFEGKVNVQQLDQLYALFVEKGADVLYLMPDSLIEEAKHIRVSDSALPVCQCKFPRFSFQAAFWKKSALCRLLAKWEDPWHSEFYGQLRMRFMHPFPKILMCLDEPLPIPYDPAGALHGGGKWYMPVLDRIDQTDLDLDLSRREKYRYNPHENFKIVWHDIKPSISNVRSMLNLLYWAIRCLLLNAV